MLQRHFYSITAGGGIRNVDDVKNILKSGADKISINTAVLKHQIDDNLLIFLVIICISIEAKKIVMIIIVIMFSRQIQKKSL